MKVIENYIFQTYGRKYEPEAGRFLSIDPLWENYYAWMPYQYCGNDPVNSVDLMGLFDMQLHALITAEAFRKSNNNNVIVAFAVSEVSMICDVYNADKSAQHYDNNKFTEGDNFVDKKIKEKSIIGLGEALHATQDFYAHSNYVKIAMEVFNINEEDPSQFKYIPTYEDAIQNEKFQKRWAEEGKSGIYPDKKDDASPIYHKDLNNDNAERPYFKAARNVAVRASINVINNW